jgi:hypothetical protein
MRIANKSTVSFVSFVLYGEGGTVVIAHSNAGVDDLFSITLISTESQGEVISPNVIVSTLEFYHRV